MICRFVEESLCNVGKHAIGATFMRFFRRQEGGENLIQIIDDGRMPDDGTAIAKGRFSGGEGTSVYARRLGGTR
jgi:signal transduction histidine kinase